MLLPDYWKIFRWEITFVTFSASQYIFFFYWLCIKLNQGSWRPDTFTRDLGEGEQGAEGKRGLINFELLLEKTSFQEFKNSKL